MNYIGNASSYLTETLLGLALYVVLLRFWMQWVRADFRNPIGQFLIAVTNPVIVPLRRVLPSIGFIDTATVLLAFAMAVIKTLILAAIVGYSPAWLSLLAFSFGELLRASIYIFMAAIFIQIIASWINPHSYHPVVEIARSIGEPLMAPARRIIPPIAGLDLSPILVFLFLQLSLQLVVAPLQHL
ncbi:MAG: YggT family protein [Gammaproteobacteria bacterium]|nr:YggT family protein [Gammaproteobacteria bacterium]